MTTKYEISIKQRSGKWAPQCERDTAEQIQECWERMQSMGRKLRCVKIEDGVRTLLCKFEPVKP